MKVIMDAPEGSPESDALEILVTLVEAYAKKVATESPPPDPIQAIEYFLESRGAGREDFWSLTSGPWACVRDHGAQTPADNYDDPQSGKGNGHSCIDLDPAISSRAEACRRKGRAQSDATHNTGRRGCSQLIAQVATSSSSALSPASSAPRVPPQPAARRHSRRDRRAPWPAAPQPCCAAPRRQPW